MLLKDYCNEIVKLEKETKNLEKEIESLDRSLEKYSATGGCYHREWHIKEKKKCEYNRERLKAIIRGNDREIQDIIQKIRSSKECMDILSVMEVDGIKKLKDERDKLNALYDRNSLRLNRLTTVQDHGNLNGNFQDELYLRKAVLPALQEIPEEFDKLIESSSEEYELFSVALKYMDDIDKKIDEEIDEKANKEFCSDCLYKNWKFEGVDSICISCNPYNGNKRVSGFNNAHVTIEAGRFSSTMTDIVDMVLKDLGEVIPIYFNSYYETPDGPRYEYVGSCKKYKRIRVVTDEYFERHSKIAAEDLADALNHVWIECTVDNTSE